MSSRSIIFLVFFGMTMIMIPWVHGAFSTPQTGDIIIQEAPYAVPVTFDGCEFDATDHPIIAGTVANGGSLFNKTSKGQKDWFFVQYSKHNLSPLKAYQRGGNGTDVAKALGRLTGPLVSGYTTSPGYWNQDIAHDTPVVSHFSDTNDYTQVFQTNASARLVSAEARSGKHWSAGYTEGTVNNVQHNGGKDVLLIDNGVLIGSTNVYIYGGPDDEQALTVTAGFNIWVGGYTTGTHFGPNNGGEEAFFMRVDRDNGNILYNTTIGGSGNDRVTFMNVGGSSSEDLVVCGTTTGAVDGSVSANGLMDIWIAYYRGQNQVRNWIKQVGTASADYRPMCFLDRFNSDVYLVGLTQGSIIPGQTSTGSRWFAMRYNVNGAYQSGRYLTTAGVTPELVDMHVNSTKLLICGASQGSLNGTEVANGEVSMGTALIVEKTLIPGPSNDPDPTPTPTPTPSPTAINCGSFENCSSCTAQYGCGWCLNGEVKCQAGSAQGPSDGECAAPDWKFDLCDDGGAVLAGVVTAVVVVGAAGGAAASASSSAASGASGAGAGAGGASGASVAVPQPIAGPMVLLWLILDRLQFIAVLGMLALNLPSSLIGFSQTFAWTNLGFKIPWSCSNALSGSTSTTTTTARRLLSIEQYAKTTGCGSDDLFGSTLFFFFLFQTLLLVIGAILVLMIRKIEPLQKRFAHWEEKIRAKRFGYQIRLTVICFYGVTTSACYALALGPGTNGGSLAASFAFALMTFLAFSIGFTCFIAYRMYKTAEHDRLTSTFVSKFGSLFSDYSKEDFMAGVGFVIRRLIVAMLVGFAYNQPQAQMALLIIFQIAIVAVVAWKKPFQRKDHNIVSIAGESLDLLSLLILLFYLDPSRIADESAGTAVIVFQAIALIGKTALYLWTLKDELKSLWEKITKKNQEPKTDQITVGESNNNDNDKSNDISVVEQGENKKQKQDDE